MVAHGINGDGVRADFQSDPDSMKPRPSVFVYGDENFSAFEELLKSWSCCSREIWRLRVDIHQLLADPALSDQRRCFKFGFFSYLPWLMYSVFRATWKLPKRTKAPESEFLVHICGASGKEFEILAPIVRSLLDRGKTVGIAWLASGELSLEVRKAVDGAELWQIRSDEIWGTAGLRILGDAFVALGRWSVLALRLGMEPMGARTLWRKSTRLVHRFIELRVLERFFARSLASHDYSGIGLASDTSASGAALARVCLRRGWPSHHFLHGPPDLVHARSLATDLYCFSKVEVDFLVSNGVAPNHVNACGHPRQARLRTDIVPRRIHRPEVGGLRLLYAAQPSIGSFDARMHAEVVTTVLGAAKKLALTKDEFRIRIHPGDDPRIIRGLAASILGEQFDGYLSTGSVADDLAWANVLTTLHSTMALEAAYVDVQVVWLFVRKFRHGIRDGLLANGYGKGAETLEELIDTLSHLRNDASRKESLEKFRVAARALSIVTTDPAGVCAERMQKPES